MPKSWFEYGEITSESLFNSLPKQEKDILDRFKNYMLISASEERADEGQREVLRFREITNKPLNKINLEDLRHFLLQLKKSDFGDHTKNKIKGFVHRFLKWEFKDWSERFSEFEDMKLNSDAQNKKTIDSKTILSKEDIEKLLKEEKSLYWKTFLMVQYEGGLRTGECRSLKWNDITFEDDGFTSLNISCKKNRNATAKKNIVVVSEATNFLKELREQQKKFNINTPFVFPSHQDPNKPISKAVNLWFNALCKKVLGRPANNYLLRHTRGTELQEKVRKGVLSKDNAVSFMRHSEKMFDKVYSHMDKEDIKQLIKNQIYNKKALTKEERDELKELRERIDYLETTMKKVLEVGHKTNQLVLKKHRR